MSNPYLIEGPALISFSGGRTSGYMLWHILDAFDGNLPDDVHVAFANTGKEREETLRFVHECESRWNVRVRWLEFVTDLQSAGAAGRFSEVGYNSASRNGEPFERLIVRKQRGPNSMMRFCTDRLKVQAMFDFMETLGHKPAKPGCCRDTRRRVLALLQIDGPQRENREAGGGPAGDGECPRTRCDAVLA